MFKIDNATSVVDRPAPAPAGTPGYFTDGSAVGGVPATVVPADWLNGVQDELANAITAAGLTLAKADSAQLAAAIPLLASGRLLATRAFTSSGTYTPTAGTKKVRVTVVGGGGGGGGTLATGSGQGSCGSAGGGGGWAIGVLTSGFSGIPITVGSGGTAGAAGGGAGNGGTSSFGGLSATGGSGGQAGNAVSITAPTLVSGATAGTGSGGSIANGTGTRGAPGQLLSPIAVCGGNPGVSLFPGASAGATTTSGAGAPGSSYGVGGGGGVAGQNAAAQAGGSGSGGIVIVEEFA